MYRAQENPQHRVPGQRVSARRLRLSGHVQGVGFRPFVYRLATDLHLAGWVRNCLGEVEILVQGSGKNLDRFSRAVLAQAPPLATPVLEHAATATPLTSNRFEILDSDTDSAAHVQVPPDYFVCDDCLRELHDPADRRHHYPFINCTQCGPRYTLIRDLPYDRQRTTMAGFPLCDDCQREYTDPGDRRFHAEPIACPACGPQLVFVPVGGQQVTGTPEALAMSLQSLRAGSIVAVKGVGGYHLMCDARNAGAIARLRHLKPRPDKPLAVMFPLAGEDGLAAVRQEVSCLPIESRRLQQPDRPIVILPRTGNGRLPDAIAPGSNEIGVLLPYSPLHHLLLDDFAGPLVATSGNLSGEPVLTDNDDASRRLAHIADAFLHHNRPIARPADDAVVRRIGEHVRPLRLGRGMAPLELSLPVTLDQPLLAVGGHLKTTVALAWENRVVISPHIGEMESPRSQDVFAAVVDDLQRLYRVTPATIICDAHPGYATTHWARQSGARVIPVWHHHAHASALVGDNGVHDTCLVFTWDGVGLGPDGTLWGGETLLGTAGHWQRVASLRPFYLPGGDQAGRQPWRSAAALCWETGRNWTGAHDDTGLLHQAWQKRVNCPQTTAAGRLFDAAAALLGLCHRASFEGQGPMRLEALCDGQGEALALPLNPATGGHLEVDWSPLLTALLQTGIPVATRADTVHRTLARTIASQARHFRKQHGIQQVGLCGGVFQNRRLSEYVIEQLAADSLEVLLPRKIPANDAGLSFGQIMEYTGRSL